MLILKLKIKQSGIPETQADILVHNHLYSKISLGGPNFNNYELYTDFAAALSRVELLINTQLLIGIFFRGAIMAIGK